MGQVRFRLATLLAVTAAVLAWSSRDSAQPLPAPPCEGPKVIDVCFPPFNGTPTSWETLPADGAFRRIQPKSVVTRCFVSIPCSPTVHGVDISKYQGGNTDAFYQKLKDRGALFAYVRLSVGNLWVSDNYEKAYFDNWQKVRKAGLVPGGYHYLNVPQLYKELPDLSGTPSESKLAAVRKKLVEQATAQAAVFVSRLQRVAASDRANGLPAKFLPVALDLEADICRNETDSRGNVVTTAPDTCGKWREVFGKTVYTEMAREWVRTVVAGLKMDRPIVAFYVGPIFAADNNLVVSSILDGTGLTGDRAIVWMPKYTAKGEFVSEHVALENKKEDDALRNMCNTVTAPLARCRFHQYTQTALFDRTTAYQRDMPADALRKLGPLDVNRFIGSRDEFEKLLVSLSR